MPANRFDPVFLLLFFVCFGENGGQYIAELNLYCQWLSLEVPLGLFHLSSHYQKKTKQRSYRSLLIAHTQVESVEREK